VAGDISGSNPKTPLNWNLDMGGDALINLFSAKSSRLFFIEKLRVQGRFILMLELLAKHTKNDKRPRILYELHVLHAGMSTTRGRGLLVVAQV
jgi:hypothetical protein